jgi:hypothetical protein
LQVTTLARVSCNGLVFSNYDKESLFYQSPLMDLLEAAQLQGELLDQHASHDFTELFKQGKAYRPQCASANAIRALLRAAASPFFLDAEGGSSITDVSLCPPGADILVTLEWSCDLDTKPARQQCSIQRKVDVIDPV